MLDDFGRVTGAAEGAVDDGLSLGGGEAFEDLGHEDGVVSALGEFHGVASSLGGLVWQGRGGPPAEAGLGGGEMGCLGPD